MNPIKLENVIMLVVNWLLVLSSILSLSFQFKQSPCDIEFDDSSLEGKTSLSLMQYLLLESNKNKKIQSLRLSHETNNNKQQPTNNNKQQTTETVV